MSHFFRVSKYISVALLSAASDWAVFTTLVALLQTQHLLALIVARAVGGIVSFVSNRYWTWGGHRKSAVTGQGVRFIMLYAFSYAISISAFYLLNTTFGLSAYLAKLITDCTCFAVNYLVMNGFVFRGADPETGEPAARHEKHA